MLTFTTFDDAFAQVAHKHSLEWEDLVARVRKAKVYEAKKNMPWLKLATFGEKRTNANSLRHDANLLEITGIEGDYDGQRVPIQDAACLLADAGIEALLYTSPSHTPQAPRWRLLCPLSRPYPPDERARFVARVNGVLGGILANESFTKSQSYYIGRLADSQFEVQQTRGQFVDLLHHLDGEAIGAPAATAAAAALPPNGEAIMAGGRNHALASLAGTMRKRGMSKEAIKAALLAENAARCAPPLPDAEVRSIARSIGRYPKGLLNGSNGGEHILNIERLSLPKGGDVVNYPAINPNASAADLMPLPRVSTKGAESRNVRAAQEVWPAPRPLPSELLPVAAFDFALLPSTLRAWIEDTTDLFQCAPDYLAVSAMVAVGSMIGRRIAVRPQRKTDWTEYGNLWGLVVGRPGAMKSPAITEATRFLRRFEHDAALAYQSAMQRYSAEVEAQKRLGKDARSDALTEPTALRFIVNNATVEALHLICRENPQGLLDLRDELAGLLRTLDREEFAADRAFYLESWTGNSVHTLDRIGRGRNLSARVNLSLLGGTQPARIAGYVRSAVRGAAGDDGLLQRFGLLVWPDTMPQWRNVDRYPDSEARQAAARTFDRLRDLIPGSVGAESAGFGEQDAVPFLRLAEAAQCAFDEWHQVLMRELRSGDVHPALESHLSKYKKLVPSLALCLHLAEGGSGVVTEAAMVRALAWSEYLRTHAERLYGSATVIEVRSAKAILAKLRAGAVEYQDEDHRTFDARSIYRAGWAGLDRDATYAGLELLTDLDYLRRESELTAGRTATLWIVNPKALQ